MGFPLAAEVIGLAVEALHEITRGVEDEICIVEEIKDDRHAVDGEESGRFVSLAVKVLVPGIERQCEKASLLPFEGLLRSFVVPNGRRAPPLENVDHVFVEMSLRIQALSRGDLAHIGACCPFRAFHVDEGSVSSDPVPVRQLNLL